MNFHAVVTYFMIIHCDLYAFLDSLEVPQIYAKDKGEKNCLKFAFFIESIIASAVKN